MIRLLTYVYIQIILKQEYTVRMLKKDVYSVIFLIISYNQI